MMEPTGRGGHDPLPNGTWSGARPHRARGILAIAACLVVLAARAAAVTVIVPDHFPTIQQAIDSGANEILVRPGVYLETPVIADIPPNLDDFRFEDDLVVRGLVPVGASSDSIPVVGGFVLEDLNPNRPVYTHSPSITFSDLRFAKVVQNRFDSAPYSNPFTVGFMRCTIDSGITDATASDGGQIEYYLQQCRVDGPIWLYYPQQIRIADCYVRSTITAAAFPQEVNVTRSRFEGPGPFAINLASGGEYVVISNCTFEGFQTPIRKQGTRPIILNSNTFVGPGITPLQTPLDGEVTMNGNSISDFDIGLDLLGGDGDLLAYNNLIENCGTALRADVCCGHFVRNEIRSCGAGVSLRVQGGLWVRGNIVRACAGDGMVIDVGYAVIDSNVVGRCEGAGIRLTTANVWGYTSRLSANTSYGNTGAGIVVTANNPDFVTSLDHNISYGNGSFGLEASGAGSLEVSCNDWFANAAGAVSGVSPTSTNLTLDPLFCDVALDDVHLSAGSPLLDPSGCGRIGALGPGCSAPIVCQLTTFAAVSTVEGIEVRWQVADAAPGFVAWLERADAADGPWASFESERTRDGDVTLEFDRSAAPARSYWYRLVVTDRGLTRALGEPIRVETAPPTRFALLGTGPNPSPGGVEATFQLAHAAEITVELFDAQGRRVATLARGSWPAGIHRATWAGARPASGVYLVRYRHPLGEDLCRVAIVR